MGDVNINDNDNHYHYSFLYFTIMTQSFPEPEELLAPVEMTDMLYVLQVAH